MTLQEQADKLGISRQALWLRTPKGQAYLAKNKDKRKQYQQDYKLTPKQKEKYKQTRKKIEQTPEYKAKQREYMRKYRQGEHFKQWNKEYKRKRRIAGLE